MAFGGALGGGVGRAGKAAGGQVGAAADDAAAARESYEAASARAIVAQSKISGGELAFVEGGKRGGQPTSDGKGKGEHKVNHPVAVEIGHTVLDLAGLIPGIGDAVDLANAAWYEKDGRHVEAAITAAAAVPVAGTAAVVVKWGNNAGKLAKLVFKDGKLVKIITQEGKVLTKEGGKIAKETGKTGEKVVKTTEKNSDNVVVHAEDKFGKKTEPNNVIDAKDRFRNKPELNETKATGTYGKEYHDYSPKQQNYQVKDGNDPHAVYDSVGKIGGEGQTSYTSYTYKNPETESVDDIGNVLNRQKTAGEDHVSQKAIEQLQKEQQEALKKLKEALEKAKEKKRGEKLDIES
jgi:hypothetical protein